ncbi:malonyl CoA-acyl carrier protein transacylase [Mycobacteroides abscessus subsp. bolletii 1513]|uniref:[acyl-carrier-protein] S-malonyltransferase n=1 Tax=Mycobacteroides abscessus subsp. bolletii 1513 TaxID=1299321 RepID=X8DRP9_9MYCO|nr:malonyl CoA-acyl carrier protein transacylase [Mycobacteroides abscessus subsp. bolletii 1513]
MLTPWLELPGATDQVEQWSKASGLDLVRLGTTATAEEITDTSITQPLVVALTLLAYDELNKRGHLNTKTTVVAGHSVGEIAAYAIAGVISADEAITLAATRGAEMAKACALDPTGMSAVLGGDEAEVLERLEALELVPANRNAAGQIVAAAASRRWRSWPRIRRPRPAYASSPPPVPSTPTSWPPRRRPMPPRPPPSRRPSRPSRCCRTSTAPPSPPVPTPWPSWSTR